MYKSNKSIFYNNSSSEKVTKMSYTFNKTETSTLEPIILGYLTPLVTLSHINETGSYIVIINSDTEGGATGIFAISKSDKLQFGNIKEIVVSNGLNGEMLNVDWEPCEYPKILLHIHKLKSNQKTVSFNFNIKIL
jgi:hypothetical protein